MIVVADTTPLRYLVLIDYVHVLPSLYGRIVVPPAVVSELTRDATPTTVRTWITNRPDWLHVLAPDHTLLDLSRLLGAGEREVIALAEEVRADALLIDDQDARREAERRKLSVVGTLRVLADAAEHDFADLRTALARLRQTNFRTPEQMLQWLLTLDARRRDG